ncbi:MAG: hypothetical protein ACRDHI_02660 [Actinomycetota bacterium]
MGPGTVPVGQVTIDVINRTPEELYAAVLSIDEEHAYGDLVSWVSHERPRPPRWVTVTDDGSTPSHGTDQLTASVTSGNYGVVCATPKVETGKTIWPAGHFKVSSRVSADIGTVKISEAGCTGVLPGHVEAGQLSVAAINETDGLAGFHMWRIADGHTYEQFAAHIRKERGRTLANQPSLGPRHTDMSSLIPIELEAGESGTMTGIAQPGTYGIVCARDFKESRFGVSDLVGPIEVE